MEKGERKGGMKEASGLLKLNFKKINEFKW